MPGSIWTLGIITQVMQTSQVFSCGWLTVFTLRNAALKVKVNQRNLDRLKSFYINLHLLQGSVTWNCIKKMCVYLWAFFYWGRKSINFITFFKDLPTTPPPELISSENVICFENHLSNSSIPKLDLDISFYFNSCGSHLCWVLKITECHKACQCLGFPTLDIYLDYKTHHIPSWLFAWVSVSWSKYSAADSRDHATTSF